MYQIVLFALLIVSTIVHSFEPIPPIEPSFEQYYSFRLRLSPSYAKVWIIKPEKMLYTNTMLLKEQDYTIQVTADGYEDKIIDIKVDSQHLYPIILEREEATYTYKKMIKRNNIIYENHPFRKKYTWNEAQAYCTNLTLEGYEDWRLPTREELLTIKNMDTYPIYSDGIDFIQWFEENDKNRERNNRGEAHFIATEFIEEMPPFYPLFWTSEKKILPKNTFNKNKPDNFFWIVTFDYGYGGWINSSAYVRCVRDLM